MSDLSNVSTDALVRELSRRVQIPVCRCRKWKTYVGVYDADGRTLRCAGCFRAVARCSC